jgi:hypothetical protein
VQRPDGKRPRVHDVVRVARNPADADEVAQLAFGAFNIYELDGEDISLDYAASIARLQDIFGASKTIHPVETVMGDDAKAVLKQFKTWVLDEGSSRALRLQVCSRSSRAIRLIWLSSAFQKVSMTALISCMTLFWRSFARPVAINLLVVWAVDFPKKIAPKY